MKIIFRIRNLLKTTGYVPPELQQRFRPDLVESFVTCGAISFGIVTTFISTINGTNLFEVTDAFGISINATTGLCSFIALCWQKNRLFEFINDLEKKVNERAQLSASNKSIHEKVNSSVEFWTNLLIPWGRRMVFMTTLQRLFLSLWTIYWDDYSMNNIKLVFPMS